MLDYVSGCIHCHSIRALQGSLPAPFFNHFDPATVCQVISSVAQPSCQVSSFQFCGHFLWRPLFLADFPTASPPQKLCKLLTGPICRAPHRSLACSLVLSSQPSPGPSQRGKQGSFLSPGSPHPNDLFTDGIINCRVTAPGSTATSPARLSQTPLKEQPALTD